MVKRRKVKVVEDVLPWPPPDWELPLTLRDDELTVLEDAVRKLSDAAEEKAKPKAPRKRRRRT
jgi:hypothetical protein